MKTIDIKRMFTTGGISLLTAHDQSSRIAELEAENEELTRLLKAAAGRLQEKVASEPKVVSKTLH